MSPNEKLDSIFAFVRGRYGITRDQILGKYKPNEIVRLRRAIAVIAYSDLGMVHEDAAKVVGRSEHSASIFYQDTHNDLVETNAAYRIVYNSLVEHLETISANEPCRFIDVDNIRERIHKFIHKPYMYNGR